MTLLRSFIAFGLVGFLEAARTLEDVGIYPKYVGEHDIVNIIVPRNRLNYIENESKITIFFVEADIEPDGSRIDQGLYVFKDGNAKKILENGRDAAASSDDSKLVFFGAKDGLYVYNETTNSADKYGPITDSIIGIAKERRGDVIYILTESGEVYKVTNNGEAKEKLEDIVNAQQIILDRPNNLYFYSDDKKPYVRTADGITKIEGLPPNFTRAGFIKSSLRYSVNFFIDNTVYILHPDGLSTEGFRWFDQNDQEMPTACSLEAEFTRYFAFNKKLYQITL